MLVFLLIVSVSLSQGAIYGALTSSLQSDPTPQAIGVLAPSTGEQQVVAPFPLWVGGLLPAGFVVLPATNEGAVITVAANECVVFFPLGNASSPTDSVCSAVLVVDNIAVFNNTVWVTAYDTRTGLEHLYTVDRANKTFVEQMPLHGIIQVAISTYSDSLFFLTTQTEGGAEQNLTVVDVAARRVVYQSRVSQGIEILAWGGPAAGLFAWVATETYAGQLLVLDPATGKALRTIVSSLSLSANGGSAVFDPASDTMYACLLEYENGDAPMWTVTNVKTGKMQTYPASPDTLYPWAVGLAIH